MGDDTHLDVARYAEQQKIGTFTLAEMREVADLAKSLDEAYVDDCARYLNERLQLFVSRCSVESTPQQAAAPRVQINPCRCGHEKGDHQTRLGQRGNYTPCCSVGCKCEGFRKTALESTPKPSASCKWSYRLATDGDSYVATACGRGFWESHLDTDGFTHCMHCGRQIDALPPSPLQGDPK